MFRLIILNEAKEEWERAATYYELQKHNLGVLFSDIVEESLKVISAKPQLYQIRKKDYREAPIKKFPFIIVYKIEDLSKTVFVISVFHTSRKPSKKYKASK